MAKIKPLPLELQRIACEQLGEVPQRIPEDLQKLKEWIRMQPHLKSRTDDQFLVQFLRGTKYSLEKAKEKLEQFYALKSKYADMLSNVDVESTLFMDYVQEKLFSPLSIPLHGNGSRIIYVQLPDDPNSFTINQLLQMATTFCEILLLNDPYACINGIILVYDYSKFRADHLSLFTPSAVRNIFLYLEKALPMRFKGVYAIHISPYVEKFIKLLLPYVPEKVKDRVHICCNIDDIKVTIPKQYLPRDIGGDNGSLEDVCIANIRLWEEYREYFRDSNDYGIDESLRLIKKPNIDCDFGTGGSFRTINVD
ncbi:alpha-tocopherol transfer protein-like [Stomoxys calcitrans]|uniref:alpha-tocopherol transfer protein-like n=1 Tax=Stomoxys calcitrans TaxID=35570 RepID=UPI0027E21B42|nr:alpha-tocopherol transfer protein-like [Stomoxys calcitrans]